ncbi:PIN domain-containing protein [Candidatus Woesearchaeota archaeon]|nr:PIN domain-containing protein [Candidatus Woesearchaeota archaeon]
MACLDTSFIIDLFHGNLKAKEISQELSEREMQLSITTPTIMELWSGACLSVRSKQEKEKILQLLQSLEVLDLTREAAFEAGEIEAQLLKQGKTIDPEDCMIAGIVKANNETIVTGDRHFTFIEGLKVLKY